MKKWIAEYKRKKAIKSIKKSFRFFGHNIDDMTEGEMMEGLNRLAVIIQHSGISIKEANEALRILNTVELPEWQLHSGN